MIEKWEEHKGMHHLNRSEKCTGTYTYGRPEGPNKSANNHTNHTGLDSQKDIFVSACHVCCIRTTDKYLTIAIAVIEPKELIPLKK